MNWSPTPDEVRELERAHFRHTGRRGLAKARSALAEEKENRYEPPR